MGKETNRWYVVKYQSKRYAAIIFDNRIACKRFADGKGVGYKGFATREEAVTYAGCQERKIQFRSTELKSPRICLACEKPFHGKTKLCPTCNRIRSAYSLSVGMMVTIKNMYPEKTVKSLIEEDPSIIYFIGRVTNKKDRADTRKEKAAEFRTEEYLKAEYKKTDAAIPDYAKELISKDKSKELLYLEGDRLNPRLYYLCKKCGIEQCQTYESLKAGKGHDCASVKSSGEAIVEDYLKSTGVEFKTQHNTLKCVNCKTKRVMPYDIEMPEHNIIIEVQGEQHYSYSPYFHGSVENFEYQQWRDIQKKVFAEKHGYRVIYISYEEIRTERYKQIINDVLKQYH